jgi:hypothetical protein
MSAVVVIILIVLISVPVLPIVVILPILVVAIVIPIVLDPFRLNGMLTCRDCPSFFVQDRLLHAIKVLPNTYSQLRDDFSQASPS